MKHLLNGATIAAALVIALPAWAQAPATPGAQGPRSGPTARVPNASAPAPAAAPAAAAPMATQMHHRPMRHHAVHHGRMGKMNAGDAMTEQLNREELARLQGAAPPPPPPPMPAGGPGPRPSGR